jgi:hypothetical protein
LAGERHAARRVGQPVFALVDSSIRAVHPGERFRDQRLEQLAIARSEPGFELRFERGDFLFRR